MICVLLLLCILTQGLYSKDTTAEMRREHRHRGRSAAVSGRKPNATIQTQAIITANDDGDIYHATPRPNKRKKNNLHSLANSVAENKPSVTRH